MKRTLILAIAIGALTADANEPTLLDRVVEAMGGRTAILAVNDIVLETSIVLSGGQGDHRGDLTTEILYPDKIRTRLWLPVAGEITQGYDGRTAWLEAAPQVVDLPPTMADEMRRQVLVTGALGLVREALRGTATTRESGKSLIWQRHDDQITLTVDADSHLLTRADYRALAPQGDADVHVEWSDYRLVDGIRLPWRTVVSRNDRQYSDSLLKRARFNAGLLPAIFSGPLRSLPF